MSILFDLPARLVCTGQVAAPDAGAVLRLLLLAPLLEEWVVRAGFQEWMIRRARGGAARGWMAPPACSSAVFGLLHLGSGWRAALLVLPPGLLLALLYQRSRDWRLCALLHCGLNALALGGCALSTNRGIL
jgi:membrane protease YdiL (CAAX protease family)